jgi:hypothetical protein
MNRLKTSSSDVLARVEGGQELAIHVVFTTERETVAALQQAAKLAEGLGARLLLVAPQVVPWAAEIDRPPVSPDFKAAKMLRLAEEAGVDADVHIMLCRDRLVGLESVLGTNAIVIAGENKLASQLTKRGHQVLALDSPANAERES